jgi:hypothetical protein
VGLWDWAFSAFNAAATRVRQILVSEAQAARAGRAPQRDPQTAARRARILEEHELRRERLAWWEATGLATVAARYAERCPACGASFDPGELVSAMTNGAWADGDCAGPAGAVQAAIEKDGS